MSLDPVLAAWTVGKSHVAITDVDDAEGKVGMFDADTQVLHLHYALQTTQWNKTERGKRKLSGEQRDLRIVTITVNVRNPC